VFVDILAKDYCDISFFSDTYSLGCVYTSGFRALQASKRLLVLLWLWRRDVRRFKRLSCVTGSMENGSHAALDARCEPWKLWWAWCPGRSRPVSACISQLTKDRLRFVSNDRLWLFGLFMLNGRLKNDLDFVSELNTWGKAIIIKCQLLKIISELLH